MSCRHFGLLGQASGNEVLLRCSGKNVLTLFQITSQLSIHAWQAGFQSACARDKEEIVHYLGDIKNKQDIIAFSQAQQAADVRQIMELMQKVF